ncbi:MAG: sigma-70 family RNA polymerase sigma factor [Pseudomonadota bacterium]
MRALFARHHLRVHRFVVRLIGHEANAEDVTNETFLGVWRNASGYDGRAAVSTWVLSIAHNKAVSFLRKRRETPLDEDAAVRIADDADDPETMASKADKGTQIRSCMERLSPDHRQIIDLVYYHEKTIPEISDVLGIPHGTVKTRMFHARKRLGEHLRAAGVDRGWP